MTIGSAENVRDTGSPSSLLAMMINQLWIRVYRLDAKVMIVLGLAVWPASVTLDCGIRWRVSQPGCYPATT